MLVHAKVILSKELTFQLLLATGAYEGVVDSLFDPYSKH